MQGSSVVTGRGDLYRSIEKVLSCMPGLESVFPCLSLLVFLSISAKENGRK